MTLGDLTLPISHSDAQGIALVFPPQLAGRLAELHAQYGTPNCWPIAATLPDGRCYLHGDVLTEVVSGGLLHAMWSAADQSVLLSSVEVLPLASVLALLPPDPPFPAE
jgi:hypothetical protein